MALPVPPLFRRALAAAVVTLAGARPGVAAEPEFAAVTAQFAAHPEAYPGGVLCVVWRDGREAYRYSTGHYGETDRRPIASATKWYSGAVVLRLAARGLLDLDDPVSRHLPAFDTPEKRTLTIRQCFGMTSGLVLKGPEYETDPTLTLAESVDLIAVHTPVVFPPGSQLAYDGDGMQVVGRVCEVVSGRDWRTLAAEELFGPLGMPHSDYLAFLRNPGVAGGARSTVADYFRFLEMVRRHGEAPDGSAYLPSHLVQQFFENQTEGLPEYFSAWPPATTYPYDRRPGYAFGCWVMAQPAGGAVEEVSSPGKFGTWGWVDRPRGVTGMIFTYDPDGFAYGVYNNLLVLEHLRAAWDAAPRPPPGPPGGLRLVALPDGYLRIDWTGGGVLEWRPDLVSGDPWTPVPWAGSPHFEPWPGSPVRFFRVRAGEEAAAGSSALGRAPSPR